MASSLAAQTGPGHQASRAAAHRRRHPPVGLVRLEHGDVDRRSGLDPPHGAVPDRGGAETQPGEEAGLARQPPELGRSGQHRGQAVGGEIHDGVLPVGHAGEGADDARRDRERRQGRGGGGTLRVLLVPGRADPVQNVGNAEAGGDREREGSQASAEPQAVVERVRADPGPAEQRAAEARGAEPPRGLAHDAPERVVGARREGPEDGEPERHARTVDRDRGGALRGRGRCPLGEKPGGGHQRVLRAGREEVVQAGGEPRHQALVDRAARGEGRRERAGSHGRGDHEADIARGAGHRCPCAAPPSRPHGEMVDRGGGPWFTPSVGIRSVGCLLQSVVRRAEADMTAEPTTTPARGGPDVAEPPPTAAAAGGNRSPRRWLPRYTWSGTVGALVFGCSSLTPSLLPRGWVLQGLIAGITAAIGYGVGVTVAWFVAELTDSRMSAGFRRRAWQVLAAAGVLLCVVMLWLGAGWQRQIHELMGLDPPNGSSSVGVVVVAVLVFALFVAIGRGVRWLARWLVRVLGRLLPRRLARPLGVLIAGALVI